MADTYPGPPTAGLVSAPSVFTHPPVRRHRDARGGSAVDDAMAGDITLCSHSRTLSIQNFPKTGGGDGGCAQPGRRRAPMLCRDHPDELSASVMSATGLLATSLPQFANYQLSADVDRRHKASILINVAWPSPVVAIVGE